MKYRGHGKYRAARLYRGGGKLFVIDRSSTARPSNPVVSRSNPTLVEQKASPKI